jgi:hypothetical protein
MNKYNLLCKLNETELINAKKNPHTTQFFCEIDNIINCKIEDCDNKMGYKYQREFEDMPLKKSNISKRDIEKLYNQSELKEVMNQKKINTIEYLARKQRPSTVVHWGQLKLFLSTLQFLLYYAPRSQKVHVIYPGSAAGYNIDILTKMFPQCYWYLIDPNPFFKGLYKNPKVIDIKNELFTNESAQYYKALLKDKYTLFISDIRTTTHEDDIYENNDWQQKWVQIINPEYAQLKFRIPRHNNIYSYLEGEIYYQMFPPQATTETRLVVKKNAKLKNYNLEDYENNLYFHNRVLRACVYQYDKKDNVRGLDHCYDCSACINILKKYKKKYRKIEERSIDSIVKFIISHLVTFNKLEKETKNICNNLIYLRK